MARCLVCNSKKHEIFATGLLDGAEKHLAEKPKGMSIARCLNCGLYYYLPMPTEKELKEYHEKSYFIAESPETQTGYTNYLDENHKAAKIDWGYRMVNWLYQFDENIANKKEILDVGCATGFTTYGMSTFQLCKVQSVGVDVSEWAIDYGHNWIATQDKPQPLLCGRLQDVNLSKYKPFDYIVFWDTLEHEFDLHTTIKTTNELLRNKGLILIQTPDGEKAKKDWYYWSPHQHSCIFTYDSLSRLLNQYNIKIIKKRLSIEPDEIVLIAQKQGRNKRRIWK